LKYYSALKTGYEHLAKGGIESSFLAVPEHVIDKNLFIFTNPFTGKSDEASKQSSIVIIFSVWKTMIGTAVVSLPWAF